MRIIEIITEYPDTAVNIRYRKPNYDFDTMKDRELRAHDKTTPQDPAGWYSAGQTNPRDPHEFVKRTHLTSLLDKDAYFQFVSKIRDLKQDGYTNRFFPQVYNIDIVQDTKGNQRPRYRIEKLQPGENFSEEALLGLYDRLFTKEFDTERLKNISNPRAVIWRAIAQECARAAEKNNYTNIRDEELEQALKLVAKLVDQNYSSWNVDLHSNNIRVRGSNVGPQLVLMDPISDGGSSIPDYDTVKSGPEPNKLTPPPPPKL